MIRALSLNKAYGANMASAAFVGADALAGGQLLKHNESPCKDTSLRESNNKHLGFRLPAPALEGIE